ARFQDRRGPEIDRALIRLRWTLALQARDNEGKQSSMSHDRGGGTVDHSTDSLETLSAADRRLGERLLIWRNKREILPRPCLEGRVFRLRDPRVVGRPLLQARPFREREGERLAQEDRALEAPPHRAREDGGGRVDGPSPGERPDLRLPPLGERSPIEVRRVRGPNDFSVSHEDEP